MLSSLRCIFALTLPMTRTANLRCNKSMRPRARARASGPWQFSQFTSKSHSWTWWQNCKYCLRRTKILGVGNRRCWCVILLAVWLLSIVFRSFFVCLFAVYVFIFACSHRLSIPIMADPLLFSPSVLSERTKRFAILCSVFRVCERAQLAILVFEFAVVIFGLLLNCGQRILNGMLYTYISLATCRIYLEYFCQSVKCI